MTPRPGFPGVRPPLPPAISTRKTRTLIAIRTKVAGACQNAPAAGRDAPRHPRALAGALRAAHADRGRRHALGADRFPAGGAGDAGLAVRVSVAGLRHRDRGAYNRRRAGPEGRQRRSTARARPGSTRPWSAACSSSPASSASSTAPPSAARARSTTSSASSPSTPGTTSSTSLTGAIGLLVAGFAARQLRALARDPLPARRGLGLRHRQRRVDPRLPPGQHRRRLPPPRPRPARGRRRARDPTPQRAGRRRRRSRDGRRLRPDAGR